MPVGFMCQDPLAVTGGTDAVRLGLIGNNTGNGAFAYAMARHVTDERVYWRWDADPAEVRERCSVLVVPEASAANPVRDFAARAQFIERADLPVAVAGLGAQARHIGDPVELQPGTLRYLQALASRTSSIGVRGEFTAEVLAGYGITNTTVLGCPSNLINDDPGLGQGLQSALDDGRFANIAVTQGDQKRALRSVERQLIQFARERAGAIIFQSGTGLVAAREGLAGLPLRGRLKRLSHLGVSPASWWGQRTLAQLVGSDTHVFFNIAPWIDFLRSMDLAVGTRIHGNILAIQAGVPGICIHHDSRTEELCRTLLVPNLSVNACASAPSLEAICERASFSGSRYDANRADLAVRYRDLLHAANLATDPGLDRIIDSSS